MATNTTPAALRVLRYGTVTYQGETYKVWYARPKMARIYRADSMPLAKNMIEVPKADCIVISEG